MSDKIMYNTIQTILADLKRKLSMDRDETIKGQYTFEKTPEFPSNPFQNSGKNYLIISGRGTPLENYNEFLETYAKLSVYKGFWNIGTSYSEGNIVLSSGQYYKAKEDISGTPSQDPDYEMGSTDYWQFIEFQEDVPFEDIWNIDDYGMYRDFAIDDLVQMYVEVYDEALEDYIYGYAKYKCIQNITLNKAPDIDTQRWEVYNGEVLIPSVNNRYTVVLNPGYYGGIIVSNVQYVDIVSLTGEPNVIVDGFEALANNVLIKGIKTTISRFKIGNNLSSLTISNCTGSQHRDFCVDDVQVINSSKVISGTFINCKSTVGGAFGTYERCSGTFIDCVGSGNESSFAFGNTASGVFINCSGTKASFGGGLGNDTWPYGKATGTFINCELIVSNLGGTPTHGFGYIESSGVFIGIRTGITGNAFCGVNVDYASGGITRVSGYYYNCTVGKWSFGGCYGDGGTGLFTGRAINCVADIGSFGGGDDGAGIAGKLINCTILSRLGLTDMVYDTPFTFKNVYKRPILVTTDNVITLEQHNLKVGDPIVFYTTDTLPTGLLTDTLYYVAQTNLSTNGFSVSVQPGGAVVSITAGTGNGTHTCDTCVMVNCVDARGVIYNYHPKTGLIKTPNI